MAVPVGLLVVAVLAVVGGVTTSMRGLVPSGVLVAAAAVVFLLVLTDASLDAADLPVLSWLVGHRSPALSAVAETVSLVGGTVPTGGAAVLAAAVLAWFGQRRTALIWVLGVVVGSLAIRLLKLAVERPRPPLATRLAVETSASLPSGHSLMAALGLGLTAWAVCRLTRRRTVHALALGLAAVAVAAVGVSRAYLGVHWTTDVVSGWLLGSAVAVACVTVAHHAEDRGRATRPTAVPVHREP